MGTGAKNNLGFWGKVLNRKCDRVVACFLTLLVSLVMAIPAQAAAISEVFLEHTWQGISIPQALEIDADANQTITLLVLEAMDNDFMWGRVLNVISVTSTDPGQTIISSNPFPETYIPPLTASIKRNLITLDGTDSRFIDPATYIGYLQSLNLNGARTLVLLDGKAGIPHFYQVGMQDLVNGSVFGHAVLDSWSYTTVDSARAMMGRDLLDASSAEVLIRPATIGATWGNPIAGTLHNRTAIIESTPNLAVTPGWSNPVWNGHLPEPASLTLSALGLSALLLRRNRVS